LPVPGPSSRLATEPATAFERRRTGRKGCRDLPGPDRFRHVHRLRDRRESLGWWHSFELPDGTTVEGVVPLDNLRRRIAQFPIPEDLRGKRVLDIGAWDGWYSFELERRGAEVLAIDVWDNPRFHEMRDRLGSRVDYRLLDVYDLDPSSVGRFDVVLFLGVLYHLKHPLLALERVCSVTTDLAAVDSFVWTSRRGWRSRITKRPVMEFFESDEFGGQTDNWVAPTLPCLMSFCRTAGFARVELQNQLPTTAALACRRAWEDPVDGRGTAPHLTAAHHHTDFGINFATRRDDYLTAWFEHAGQSLSRADVRPEVGGFGTIPIHVDTEGDAGWRATFMLPPGLPSGWHPVRVRVGDGPPSNAVEVAVDVPVPAASVTIIGVADGSSWTPDALSLSAGTTLCLWVDGLPANADRANLGVALDDDPLEVTYVAAAGPNEEPRQVNVEVPADQPLGRRHLRAVLAGGESSPPAEVDIRA